MARGRPDVTDSGPISWRSVVYGTRVVSSDDGRVGTVREVLGSDGEDIFHGLRVTLAGGHRDVLLPADDVESLSAEEIRSDLTRAEIDALPAYDEEATYHLASVGWLRKHLGWKRDSKSDEEPG
jgi:PRC-barrel domain protein